MQDYSLVAVGAIAGAMVGVLAKVIEVVVARYRGKAELARQEADARIAERRASAEMSVPINEQAVRVYKEIIDSLRADITRLTNSLQYQQTLLLQCREEKIALKAELESLKAEISDEGGRKH